MTEVDLAKWTDERFVSLSEGFVTYNRFVEAFKVAGMVPNTVITTGNIFSLMNLVSGGIGCTLFPGQIRDVVAPGVRLIAMRPRYHMRQKIVMVFLRKRERDPNLLSLLAACRIFAADVPQLQSAG